ncbi:hypothetical protein GOP47_0022862 [Adiantum capillus-veneris]|uniref:Uncharacterized protein n=1 Tax=Adiantum capillus-veneris TaxID=13818 RepID=A0A9D4U6E0_ADICA|nr:hypothetical protein GOP47_0022862 [Adiantum capillus-veneris]
MATPRRTPGATKSDSRGEDEETFMTQRPVRTTQRQRMVVDECSEDDDDLEMYTHVQTSPPSKEEGSSEYTFIDFRYELPLHEKNTPG